MLGYGCMGWFEKAETVDGKPGVFNKSTVVFKVVDFDCNGMVTLQHIHEICADTGVIKDAVGETIIPAEIARTWNMHKPEPPESVDLALAWLMYSIMHDRKAKCTTT